MAEIRKGDTQNVILENGVLTVAEGVTKIHQNAFEGMDELVKVILPSTLKEIGGRAFAACPNLKEMKIPYTTKCWYGAFDDSPNLVADIDVPDLMTWAKDTCIDRNIPAYRLFINGELLTDLVYPADYEVKYNIFKNCLSLTSLTVTEAKGSMACFDGCRNLRTVTLADELTKSPNFTGCTALTEVKLPASLEHLPDFTGCTALTSIRIPEGTNMYWSEYALANCTALVDVVLPSTIYKIPEGCFKGCTALRSIEIPQGVSNIADSAFRGCTALTSISFASRMEIECDAFRDCTSLVSVSFENGAESIAESAFRDCAALTTIKGLDKVSCIGDNAFAGCAALVDFVRPTGDAISETAFDTLCRTAENAPLFESYYRYTETAAKGALEVKGEGLFARVPCTEEKADSLLAVCKRWRWQCTHEFGIDGSRSDYGYDRETSVVRREYLLYPAYCLVKDEKVIGFVRDGVILTFKNATYEDRDERECERGEVHINNDIYTLISRK